MTRQKENILIADDEPNICELYAGLLTSEDTRVDIAHDGERAIELLNSKPYSVCIVDLRMPNADGLDVLKFINEKKLPTKGILATGHGALDSAVEALRCGAYDYIVKPIQTSELLQIVRRARDAARESLATIPPASDAPFDPRTMMIGESPQMKNVFELVMAVADSDSTVLILGESGTGKELVAQTIHLASKRANEAMIPVNCGALPDTLLESELFGHVRGAFTGAISNRPGRFQLAHRGTIFLDEVGEMPPQLQVRLLRVLQEGTFEPVGATKTSVVNVRVVAATNRNLEDLVASNEFREDLYYRLNVIPITLPPLRDRIDTDLDLLIGYFTECVHIERGRRIAGFTDEALDALRRHDWPGNVRELENLIERCAIIHNGKTVGVKELPEKFQGAAPLSAPTPTAGFFPDTGVDLNQLVDQFETDLILKALEKSDGVKNRAAQLLNIKRTTLVEKIKKKKLLG